MSFRSELQSMIPAMRRFARGLVRDREIADDLVQETLLRALRAESRWRGGPMRVWLMTILTNLNRNRVRGLSRRGEPAPLEDAERIIGSEPTTGEAADIRRALDSLSVEHREVLLLVAVEGMTYAEMAQTLAVPLGTVMSRLSRARSSFKTALDGPPPRAPGSVPHLRVVK